MTDPIAKKYKTTVLNHFDLKDMFLLFMWVCLISKNV